MSTANATPPISAIALRTFTWLWPGWLARGILTLLDGDPGLGKSTLAIELATHISRGTNVRVPPTVLPPDDPELELALKLARSRSRASEFCGPPRPAAPAPPPPETRPPGGVLILSA